MHFSKRPKATATTTNGDFQEVTMATGDDDTQTVIMGSDDTQTVIMGNDDDSDDDIQEIPTVTNAAIGNEQQSTSLLSPPPHLHPNPPTPLQETLEVSEGPRGKPGYDGRFHGKDMAKMNASCCKFHCICGKSYNHAPTLWHHIKYQTWQWKFRCSECGLLFYGANYLRKHMVSAHKVEPGDYMPTYGCRRCGKLYKEYNQLVLHQKLAHR